MEIAFFFGYKPEFYNEIMVEVEKNIKAFKISKNKKEEWINPSLCVIRSHLELLTIIIMLLIILKIELNKKQNQLKHN